MISKLTKFGWQVIESVLLLVILCVLLHIVLGNDSGSFITAVAANATEFMKQVPSGTFLGIFLILFLYWLIRRKV